MKKSVRAVVPIYAAGCFFFLYALVMPMWNFWHLIYGVAASALVYVLLEFVVFKFIFKPSEEVKPKSKSKSKTKWLLDKKIAYAIIASTVFLGIFLGAVTSYSSMRNRVEFMFARDIVPMIEETVVFAFNVQTVGAANLSPFEIDQIGIMNIVRDIKGANRANEIHKHYGYLFMAVHEVNDRLAAMTIPEANRELLETHFMNFSVQSAMLFLSDYNRFAARFNDGLNENFGPLVSWVVKDMPRFDN